MTQNRTYPTPTPEAQAFVRAILSLYNPNRTRFNTASTSGIYMRKTRDRTKPLPLAEGHLLQHRLGAYAVCVFGQADGSHFTCFDVDDGGWPLAAKAIEALTDIGIPRDAIHVSTSGGKGYHIEIFYDSLVPYDAQKRIYNDLLRRTETDTHAIELRPTATQSIKLPLSKHHKTGNMCWFLDRDTGEEIQDMTYLERIVPIPKAQIDAIAASLPVISREVNEHIYDSEYSVPVDLNNLPRIEEAGTRHTLVMRIGTTLFNHGYSRADAEEILQSWYEEQAEEISNTPYREGMIDIRNSIGWVYNKYIPGKVDKFRMTTKFTYSDLQFLLHQRGFAKRVLLFDALAWQNVTGKCTSTLTYLSEAAGLTRLSLTRVRKQLEESGILSVTYGKAHRTEDGFCRDHSVCRVSLPQEAAALPADAQLKPFTEFNPMDLKNDFWHIYFHALFDLADRSKIMPYLCKRERDRLAALEKAGDAE